MGILRQGIFGGFENRTGPLVGRKVHGKSIIVARQHRSKRVRTQVQRDQQVKFKLVLTFLKRFTRLISVGFRDAAGKGNAFNAAVKYNFKRIVVGQSSDYAIDCTRLVYSRGRLAGANNPVLFLGLNLISLSWLPEPQSRFNRNTDLGSFLVYCPDKQVTLIFEGIVNRAALGIDLALPVGLTGLPLHVYMSFASANGKEVSDSRYLGMVEF